ncbi:MAG: cache domain-containing protein, partial [Desulfobacterales bacterium]|nr:cache domain-containing protein [Desulfobacterales bacterium]
NIQSRVNEAHAIALHIYKKNAGQLPDHEIKQQIIAALRPIRFDNGQGYYFINGFDGRPKLLADRPENEGRNLLDIRDARGKYVVRDIIRIIREKREGFYSYVWTKPGRERNTFRKISFVKYFEPFEWFIGTGVYLDTVESNMQRLILDYVNAHRFGPSGQGYVFVNELLDIDGGDSFARVYANPNRPDDTGRVISDQYRDAKGKQFRKEFLAGLRDHGECFVDYWYRKIEDATPSPKTSFFKLTENKRFIVAAGVYLDDVETHIRCMQNAMKNELLRSIALISSVFILVTLGVILFFNQLGKRFWNDFHIFEDFFRQAAGSSKDIDPSNIRFREFDRLAAHANQMLVKKRAAETALLAERQRLENVVYNQKRTEAALRKSEEEYRVLIENANDAIYILQDGVIKFCNPVTETITGYSAKDLASLKADSLVHPDDREFALTQYKNQLKGTPGPTNFPFRMIRQDTETIWAEVSTVPIEWDGQRASLNFLRDITEQKTLERQLIQSQKSEAVGTLAGGIAHDFNNLLFPLIGYAEMLKEDLRLDSPNQGHVSGIMEAALRARDLVRQILVFCRVGGDIDVKPIRIQPILKETLKLLSVSLPSTIKLQSRIDPDCGPVVADPTQVHQVIMNLATNAFHAMKSTGGSLGVHLSQIRITRQTGRDKEPDLPEGCYALLGITDTGAGIDGDVMDKMFDPYFTTKTKESGTGLGLAVVKGIVDRCGGSIQAASNPGKGTQIHVYFPVAQTPHKTRTASIKEIATENGEHILLVDDDRAVLKMENEILTRLGYRVTAESSSLRALELFKTDSGNYDLVVSDMTMPELTGLQLAREIKQVSPDIPFIICTGFNDQVSAETVDALDIQGFIQKPVLKSEMSRVIHRSLHGRDQVDDTSKGS